MKPALAILIGIVTLGLAASSMAREGETDRAQAGRLREALKRFDDNGNGRLDAEEQAKARRYFSQNRTGLQRDTDNPGGRAPVSRQQYQQRLRRFDANKNGRLDPPEIARARRQRTSFPRRPGQDNRSNYRELLRKYDADGNGRLDPKEREKVVAEVRSGNRPTNNRNAPSDRKVDEKKTTDRKPNTPNNRRPTTPQQRERFLLGRFDTNKNGKLDPDERAKIQQAFAGRRGGGGGLPIGSLDESGEPAKSKLDKVAALKKFDEDGDGSLSPTERRNALRSRANKRKE